MYRLAFVHLKHMINEELFSIKDCGNDILNHGRPPSLESPARERDFFRDVTQLPDQSHVRHVANNLGTNISLSDGDHM